MGIEGLFEDGIEGEPPVDDVETQSEPIAETPEAPELEPLAPVVEKPAPQEDAKSIPLPVFLDMRDKLKAAERERDELRGKITAPEAKRPDPYDDPDGYDAALTAKIESARVQDRIDFSHQLAVEKHGEDKVETARLWAIEQAGQDPAFEMTLNRQRHPMEWIVQQHAETVDLLAYRNDPVAFAKALLEKHGQQAVPAAAVVAEPAPVAPPRSLASSPSKASVQTEPPGSAIEALFSR